MNTTVIDKAMLSGGEKTSQVSVTSLHKLENLLNPEPFNAAAIKKSIPSFYIAGTLNEKYVAPNFTEEIGNIKDKPQVVFVSAAGATGKSELTKYLSAKLGIPVFDLAKHRPVASNSLTGLFFETLSHDGLAQFVQQLKSGQGAIIIDALDEGHLKTTVDGFNAFLDEIADICDGAINTPFILLGRTQVVEHSWLYLSEKGIASVLLKIEPFTTEQARQFIDKQYGETNYDKEYRDVRDYIIQSVEGFFKNPSEIGKKEYQSFIGYAPVLQAIVTLLQKTNNFKALHEDLMRENDRGIKLIITIVEYILKREQDQKIRPLLDQLLRGRAPEFASRAQTAAYSVEEQCARILFTQLKEPINFELTEDIAFNKQYEEKIAEWLKEHPFIANCKIQNAVFECYIIARLMNVPKYSPYVFEYLHKKYKDAFMLFFIFDKLTETENRVILPRFLPFLYSSIKSLDDKKTHSTMAIEVQDEEFGEDADVPCEVEFSVNAEQTSTFAFNMSMPTGDSLILSSALSGIFIDAPIHVILNGKRAELMSPVSINCAKISINTAEFVVEMGKDDNEGILLDADIVEVDYSLGNVPNLINHMGGKPNFAIFAKARPDHPFGEFFVESRGIAELQDNELVEKYLRLRKIIMLFRSHSKGSMAKLKAKIESKRVLKNTLGEKVLRALLDSNILSADAHLYRLNPDVVSEHLGITYLDLKRKIIGEKVIQFLNKIQ